jgi:hypothetical protein
MGENQSWEMPKIEETLEALVLSAPGSQSIAEIANKPEKSEDAFFA